MIPKNKEEAIAVLSTQDGAVQKSYDGMQFGTLLHELANRAEARGEPDLALREAAQDAVAKGE